MSDRPVMRNPAKSRYICRHCGERIFFAGTNKRFGDLYAHVASGVVWCYPRFDALNPPRNPDTWGEPKWMPAQ